MGRPAQRCREQPLNRANALVGKKQPLKRAHAADEGVVTVERAYAVGEHGKQESSRLIAIQTCSERYRMAFFCDP